MRSKQPELIAKIKEYAEKHYVSTGRYPSTTEISEYTGIARGTAYKYLVHMSELGIIRYDGHSIKTAFTDKCIPSFSETPICGSVPCGPAIEEEGNIEAIVHLPTAIFGTGKLFILTADGNSMKNAGIDDGDLVVLSETTEACEGDIVAALVDGKLSTLKRYHINKKTGQPELRPDNPDYDTIIPEHSLSIQGVARKIIKNA